jgi:hypothetical protein
MLVGAATLARSAPGVAGAWLACGAVANVMGCWLWCQRDKLRPYPALQLLLATCGTAGLLAWFSLQFFRPEMIHLLGWSRSEYSGYKVLLVVPALMAWFALLEYSARRSARPRT